MRSIITVSLSLALVASSVAGSALAQADTSPASSPSPLPSSALAPSSVPAEASVAVSPDSSGALPLVESSWRRVRPGRGPAGREDHTWTVDGDGRFAYLYGGRAGAREFGDLWRYDLRRDRWRKLSPVGVAPGRRFGHSAVWVEGTGLVLFGGQRGTGFFRDLWAFDPERGRWRRLPSRGSVPRARYGSCLVVGPDGRLWISHGFTSAGRFDDTRAYNLMSRRWATITPDERKPGERCLHDCFTRMGGELVLYGGQDDDAFALGDLWTMGRDRSWTRLDDPAPEARRLYAVTEAGGHAYIFGGATEDNSALGDLWRVDRDTLAFERVRTRGSRRPSARYAATLITDAERARLLLFGGQGASARSDLWELVETAAPESEETAEVAPSERESASTSD